MKYEELAFFNQQLGTMLANGVPLEGALEQLCHNLQQGSLRGEMEQLATDLKSGTPLDAALAARNLPPFYKQMVRVGVQANDLPGILLLLADYYRNLDSVWIRLRGLMVYPVLVLAGALGLSCLFAFFFQRLNHATASENSFFEMLGTAVPPATMVGVWVPPLFIGILLVVTLLALLIPPAHRHLAWRLPAFKEAKLAQFASAMQLMLKSGGNLNDALALAGQLEHGTRAGREVAQWQTRLAGGRGKFLELAAPGGVFPPLFLWLVGNSGEDLAEGFKRAAEIYGARAAYRIEMFLYAALPFSILGLGLVILCQIVPMMRVFTAMMNGLGVAD